MPPELQPKLSPILALIGIPSQRRKYFRVDGTSPKHRTDNPRPIGSFLLVTNLLMTASEACRNQASTISSSIRDIYQLHSTIDQLIGMAEKKGDFVPSQKIIGMQVIDSKGSSIGTVKDVAVNVTEKKIHLVVTSRARSDLEIPWDDIQSVVDVVLLRKEIQLPKLPEAGPVSIPPPPPPPSVCPSCGTSVIPTARFCPKCGSKLR